MAPHPVRAPARMAADQLRARRVEMVDRISVRGVPLALILVTRVVVVGFGIAAGLALMARRPGAATIARISLGLTAAVEVFVYSTSYFPTNLPPGDAKVYGAASVLNAAAW